VTRMRGPILVLGLLAAVLPSAAAAAPREVKVMTFNIARARETANDLDPITDAIDLRAPDVVGVQEVDRSWSRSGSFDQTGELALRLGMFSAFDPNLDCTTVDLDHDGSCQYGTAVLSRWPIRASATRQYGLPRRGTDEPRGLAQVGVSVGGRRVTLFNTHLSVPRVAHAQQILRIVQVLARTRGPYVLMGDFNTRPNAPELRPLLRRATDAAREMNVRRPTVGNTRVDYVFVSSGITILSARVPPKSSHPVSDHRPLIVRLRVGGPRS
jgi:endonuclease/exonuclease/phosphatase family metal-dependent hydrolase